MVWNQRHGPLRRIRGILEFAKMADDQILDFFWIEVAHGYDGHQVWPVPLVVEIEKLSGEAVFLSLGIMPGKVLRMKNHLTRLPIQNLEAVA